MAIRLPIAIATAICLAGAIAAAEPPADPVLQVVDAPITVTWRQARKRRAPAAPVEALHGRSPFPGQVEGRPHLIPHLPPYTIGDLTGSPDGWLVASGNGLLMDLRQRCAVTLGSPIGPILALDQGWLCGETGRMSLAHPGTFQAYPDAGIPQLPGLWRRPLVEGRDWAPVFAAPGGMFLLGGFAIPGTPLAGVHLRYREAVRPNEEIPALALIDLDARQLVAALGIKELPGDDRLWRYAIPRLALGMAESAKLTPEQRAAFRRSGGFQQAILLTGRKPVRCRLEGDRVRCEPVAVPVAGLLALAHAEDGRTILTATNDRITCWDDAWNELSSVRILASTAGSYSHDPVPGMIPIYGQDTAAWLLDVGHLELRHDAQRSNTRSDRPWLFWNPDGAFARAPAWPRPMVRLTPAGIDWEGVQGCCLSRFGNLGWAIVDDRMLVTRLPDGEPRPYQGRLPKPPFRLVGSPDGSSFAIITRSSITLVDAGTLQPGKTVATAGEPIRWLNLMGGTGWHEGGISGVTADGRAFHRRNPVLVLEMDAFVRPGDWPRIIIGPVQLDLATGVLSPSDLSWLQRQLPPDAGRITRLMDRPAPEGRWAVEVEAQAGRRLALLDPAGERKPILSPAMDGNLEDSGPVAGPVWWTGRTSSFLVWNADTGAQALLMPQEDGSVAAISDDGYMALPRQLTGAITLAIGDFRCNASAFDLQLNRPDLVLRRIGLPDDGQIGLLRRAWEIRLAKLGIAPGAVLPPDQLATLPRAELRSRPPLLTERNEVAVDCAITGLGGRPVRLVARVRGMPVATTGILPAAGSAAEATLSIALHAGINRIELVPVLADGSPGAPATAVVRRTGGSPRVVVAALGVSHYREPGRDLDFAAADARDLAAALAGSDPQRSLVLTDDQVVREAVPRVAAHLAGAGLDDIAVLFVAAHGLVEGESGYRIATADTDFAAPGRRGLDVESLLAALRASPARQRLLLIDCCHAGEIDAEELAAGAARLVDAAGAKRGGTARGLHPVVRPATVPAPAPAGPASASPATAKPPPAAGPAAAASPAPAAAAPPSRVARTVFLNAGWDDGITVLAACRGDEPSFESPAWGHGAFTFALLRALREQRAQADGDGNGGIDLQELGRFAMQEVSLLTGGQQHPEIRAGELDPDLVLSPGR